MGRLNQFKDLAYKQNVADLLQNRRRDIKVKDYSVLCLKTIWRQVRQLIIS